MYTTRSTLEQFMRSEFMSSAAGLLVGLSQCCQSEHVYMGGGTSDGTLSGACVYGRGDK